ncbi:putative rhamnosyltransferase [Algoriphagus aquaeductus]|uniref:Putative rhamnosyltransferase n=1 Tax=Algoriphagus aquaeductus TaxID=475299 RepID=A0A326RK58_9BACT|nr:glycosyltransferase [Algoriphagus aquaeductus]PZV76701.1 putative rhamnosyltransferase [Algoriphagus aquaeductus]
MDFFLITQFNLGFKQDERIFRYFDSPEKWLDFRYILFYKFSYPCVANQTDKNFKWVIAFDQATSNSFIEEFVKGDKLGLFEILLTNADNFQSDLKTKILGMSQDNLLCTVRLDSDDGLIPTFICKLKKESLKINEFPFGVNFLKGYIVDVTTGIFYLKSFFSNPFFALIEERGDFKSVFFEHHHILSAIVPTLNVSSGVNWIQNIHHTNLGNKIKGLPILSVISVPGFIRSLYPSYSLLTYFEAILSFFKTKFRNVLIKMNIKKSWN